MSITSSKAVISNKPIYHPLINVNKIRVNFYPYNDSDAIVLINSIVANTVLLAATEVKSINMDVAEMLKKAGLIDFYFPKQPDRGYRATEYLLKNWKKVIAAINESERKASGD